MQINPPQVILLKQYWKYVVLF